MARRPNEQGAANPARGAALVLVAVVIGLVLLRHGLDTSETITSTPTHTDSSGTDSVGSTTSTSTSSSFVRPPSQVPAIVLNGSGTKGAAKKYSDALIAAGYTHLTNPVGGNATAEVSATQVLYGPTFQKEAQALALAIGAPASSVQPLGTSLPGSTNGANVVVVLGPDLGSKAPPTAGATTTSSTTPL